jgi:hypothetical protein
MGVCPDGGVARTDANVPYVDAVSAITFLLFAAFILLVGRRKFQNRL